MIVSVIGTGALGKAYGGILALAGHEVHYLVRSEYQAIHEAGHFTLHFSESQRSFDIQQPRLYREASELPPSDLILIALKTTSNAEIPALMQSCRSDRSIIIVIQNGLGNEEWVAQFSGASPLLCGISMMGSVRRNAIDVDIPWLGTLLLAPFRPEYSEAMDCVRSAFAESPFATPIAFAQDHRAVRWLKLLWNLPFGALSIMYHQPTHILASEEPYQSLVKALIHEIQAIALADGFLVPEASIEEMMTETRNHPGYFPSTYVDFKGGRKIEKEYIFDNVLRFAQQKNVSTPMLHMVDRYLDLATTAP